MTPTDGKDKAPTPEGLSSRTQATQQRTDTLQERLETTHARKWRAKTTSRVSGPPARKRQKAEGIVHKTIQVIYTLRKSRAPKLDRCKQNHTLQ